MKISFYLLDDDTEITSFTGLTSNPFNLNDVVNLSVKPLRNDEYEGANKDFIQNVIYNNHNAKEAFNLKEIRLLTEKKYIKFNVLSEPELYVEYHCQIVK